MSELRGMSAFRWKNDPKLLGVVLARYKFAGRMLEGMGRVLEVGCSDGFASRVVRQHVQSLAAVDVDSEAITLAIQERSEEWPIDFSVHDIMDGPLPGHDAVYCLDVFEHLIDEDRFLRNLRASAPVAVIGTPSLESQRYASETSRAGHVNCKNAQDLRAAIARHWRRVFLFSMNDEVVHTGFYPMAHYLLALATD